MGKIRLYEIELNLESGIKILGLGNMEFEDIRKIKKKFESLQN